MTTRSVRIPDELDERLKERAVQEHRSMNSTLICALEMYLDGESVAEPEDAR